MRTGWVRCPHGRQMPMAYGHQVRETPVLTSRPFAMKVNMAFPQEARLEACLEKCVSVISFF